LAGGAAFLCRSTVRIGFGPVGHGFTATSQTAVLTTKTTLIETSAMM